MALRVYDTLTGRIRPVSRRPGRPLGMYVCGPTVYAPAHVGHARTFLYFDVVRRSLLADGVPVRHVMNITDFEEKIDRKAAALGISWRALARREEAGFFRDLDALGILRPTYRPRASDFIPSMVKIAARLAKTGRVRREGDACFYRPPDRPREENFPVSGELAEHAVPEPGHPFPANEAAASEFMVWQRQEPPLPSWKGPWGPGMPGWHLECYAMAERYLGIPIDLHGGGLDLVYPHHHAENEIALALTGHPFARCYLHTAFVLQGGRKMSKSTQNLVSIRDALAGAGAPGLRWYLLNPRYSARLEWDSEECARASEEHAEVRSRLRNWLGSGRGGSVGARRAEALARAVQRDLSDNLGTHLAIEHVRDFSREIGRDVAGGLPRGERSRVVRAIGEVESRLGIPLH
jgi:cysteinyl-tRNA synthetase